MNKDGRNTPYFVDPGTNRQIHCPTRKSALDVAARYARETPNHKVKVYHLIAEAFAEVAEPTIDLLEKETA